MSVPPTRKRKSEQPQHQIRPSGPLQSSINAQGHLRTIPGPEGYGISHTSRATNTTSEIYASESHRQPRALQACKGCRSSKIKCDEAARCRQCTIRNIECIRDPFEPKPTTQDIQQKISGQLEQILQSQYEFQRTILQVLPSLEHRASNKGTLVDQSYLLLSAQATPAAALQSPGGLTDISVRPDIVPTPGLSADGPSAQESYQETPQSIEDRAPLPPDHTTGWARVLRWPALTKILDNYTNADHYSFDPVAQELGRDPLYSGSSYIVTDANLSDGDGTYQMGGRGQTRTFSNLDSVINHENPPQFEDLGLDRRNIHRLVNSFNAKLAIMVPLVNPTEMVFLIDEFCRLIPEVSSLLLSKSGDRRNSQATHDALNRDSALCIRVSIVLFILSLGHVCYDLADDNESTPSDADAAYNIPALLYFDVAMYLLCSQPSGNTFQHVQCHLLAGLYHAHFSRILESHTHYSNASRILYTIIRPQRQSLERRAARNERLSPEENALVLSFWVCLQFESDILAELDVPQSPILTWEATMPWPDLETATQIGFDSRNMEAYLAQLWLRKRMNHIHSELYGLGVQERYTLRKLNHLKRFPFIDSLRESLEGSHTIAPNWAWDSNAIPAEDILAARLRAKYYGGVVITFRPFLRMVLNNNVSTSQDHLEPEIISPLITKYATECVIALIRSTQAFQNVKLVKPAFTNPWGTAYAQCGNVLLLLAVYQHSEDLYQYLDEALMCKLVASTKSFVRSIAESSPALWTMYRFLEQASDKVLRH